MFHPANVLSTISRIVAHISFDLNLVPGDKPRYFIGRLEILHLRKFAKPSTPTTSPTGTNSDFPRFILSPETASRHNKMLLKY